MPGYIEISGENGGISANMINFENDTIILHDYIAAQVSYEIANYLSMLPKTEPILIKINSDGGSLYDVQSIISELLLRKKVTVDITGCAFSGAAMIAMAGTHIKMSKLGMFMLHYPIWDEGSKGFPSHKKSVELTEEHFDRIMKRIMKPSTKKEHMTFKQLKEKILVRDLYLTPTECLKYGFVHKLY